jgi:hypothetical protein
MQVHGSYTAGARRAVKSSEHCPKPHAQRMFPHSSRLHPLFGPSMPANTRIRISTMDQAKGSCNKQMLLHSRDRYPLARIGFRIALQLRNRSAAADPALSVSNSEAYVHISR